MTADIFYNWFRKVFIPSVADIPRPVLLLLDNFVAHRAVSVIELADEHGIHILGFPPHSTHILQPLDVGFLQAFKHWWSKASDIQQSENTVSCQDNVLDVTVHLDSTMYVAVVNERRRSAAGGGRMAAQTCSGLSLPKSWLSAWRCSSPTWMAVLGGWHSRSGTCAVHSAKQVGRSVVDPAKTQLFEYLKVEHHACQRKSASSHASATSKHIGDKHGVMQCRSMAC
jgi:DDE superfamily endonuclease